MREHTWVAIAALVAIAAVAFSGKCRAETKHAPMSVTVVVTTTCAISSTQVIPGEAYSVACSTGTTGGVSRGSGITPRTTTTSTKTTTTSETRIVTILF